MSWKNTSESLPTVRKSGFSDYVLVWSGGFSVRSARIRDGHWRGTNEEYINRVSHWMPIPTLPTGDSGD